jgi:DNA invertase Pin-like site-specific DNA recombinase
MSSGQFVYATNERKQSFHGFVGCKKLLLYQNQWRYLCAMLIGYARVSSNEQDTAAQVGALKAAKCERIYREKASGGRWDRPELQRVLDQLRKGDVLVVWKLDRLSRSLRDVLTIMERLAEARAGFRSLTEAIDTTTPAGRLMMQMVGSFAEFERAMLRERTRVGLENARREGRIGGRPPKLTRQQQTEIVRMISKGRKTAADAARLFGVHPATISRLLSKVRAGLNVRYTTRFQQ